MSRPVWQRSKRWEKGAEDFRAFGKSPWAAKRISNLSQLLATPEWAGSTTQRFETPFRPYVLVRHPSGAEARVFIGPEDES